MALPPGKTHAEALARAVAMRECLWRTINAPEDWKIDQLQSFCTRLLGGDKNAGRDLATEAAWS